MHPKAVLERSDQVKIRIVYTDNKTDELVEIGRAHV